MFSSDAQNKENYGVRITVNQKVEQTHGCSPVLQSYIDRLYPDAADMPAKRVLIKIDGEDGYQFPCRVKIMRDLLISWCPEHHSANTRDRPEFWSF